MVCKALRPEAQHPQYYSLKTWCLLNRNSGDLKTLPLMCIRTHNTCYTDYEEKHILYWLRHMFTCIAVMRLLQHSIMRSHVIHYRYDASMLCHDDTTVTTCDHIRYHTHTIYLHLLSSSKSRSLSCFCFNLSSLSLAS